MLNFSMLKVKSLLNTAKSKKWQNKLNANLHLLLILW